MIKPENLLIVRTDRIGDVVLSLPLAGIVKKHYPECKITFLVRNYTKELVLNHPFIDNVIILEEEKGKISLSSNVKKVKSYNFNSCIIVYPTFITSLIIFLSGIKNRIGTGYRWYSLLFNKKVYEHRKYAERHELEFNINLLKNIGIKEKISPSNIEFNLGINKNDKKKVFKTFAENGIDIEKPVLIIHPGSGGSSVDLPLDKLKEMIGLIESKTDFQIILTGSPNERNICEQLVLNERVKNFAGEFNLTELTALIDISDLFISNSTGPIHIAAALKKHVIGFYPKILACSAKRWGPYLDNAVVFSPEIDCKNCTREQCIKLDCMSSIQMHKVFFEIEKIHKLLHQSEK
jgi:ADP-heptose:LPS heptosyltransferase